MRKHRFRAHNPLDWVPVRAKHLRFQPATR